jgi:DNA-binding response OmpR family regulator
MATTRNAPGEQTLKVLLVEDDPAMVSLVSLGLKYEGYEVLTASNGVQGLRLAEEHLPDLLILDWMLPELDGIGICKRVRSRSETPIIIITARDAVDDRVKGLDAGADDYLVKPFHIDELLARVRARLRHKLPATNQLTYTDLTINTDAHEATRGNQTLKLTATEFKLLYYFMIHPRQVLSKEAILEAVWEYTFGGDANIVEQYVRSLRQKIGEPALIQTVRGVGYVLREEES